MNKQNQNSSLSLSLYSCVQNNHANPKLRGIVFGIRFRFSNEIVKCYLLSKILVTTFWLLLICGSRSFSYRTSGNLRCCLYELWSTLLSKAAILHEQKVIFCETFACLSRSHSLTVEHLMVWFYMVLRSTQTCKHKRSQEHVRKRFFTRPRPCGPGCGSLFLRFVVAPKFRGDVLSIRGELSRIFRENMQVFLPLFLPH